MKKGRRCIAQGLAVLAICALLRGEWLATIWSALGDVLVPLFSGLALAFLLQPAYAGVQRILRFLPAGLRKALALLLVYETLAGLAIGFVLLLGPQLFQGVQQLSDNSGAYAGRIAALVCGLPRHDTFLANLGLDWSSVFESLLGALEELLRLLTPHLLIATAGALKTGFRLLLGLVFSCYFVCGSRQLTADLQDAMRAWLPQKTQYRLRALGRLSRRILYDFLLGQALDSAILGVACTLGMLLFGFPYAVPVGVLMCVFNLIPVVGGPVGTAVSFLMLLGEEPLQAVWFVVYLLTLQQLEGRFLYPKIVGDRLGLPPLLVLLSVICGAAFAGFFGILLALPGAAVLYTVWQQKTIRRLKLAETEKMEK